MLELSMGIMACWRCLLLRGNRNFQVGSMGCVGNEHAARQKVVACGGGGRKKAGDVVTFA